MKFIHAADLHLDRTFEGLGQVPTPLLKKLSQQNHHMLSRLVDFAIEELVDFVLIAGDTFHQPLVTIQTQVMFMAEMERLAAKNIPVVLSFGNHDFYLPDKYWFDFPKNVHLIRTEVIQTIELLTRKGELVAVSGFSYNHRWLNESKVAEFPQRNSQAAYHIGMYHGEQGLPREKGYAPFKISEMVKKNYDYWALGHIHQPQVIHEITPMIYPGTPQGHSKKEKTNAGFLLVEFTGQQSTYNWHRQPFTQWQQLEVDVSAINERKALLVKLEEELLKLQTYPGSLQLVEVILSGSLTELGQFSSKGNWQEDILLYLQEKIYQQSEEKVWPFRVSIKVSEREGELPLGVSFALLEQLSQGYTSPEEFEPLVEELYRQRELEELLPNTEEFRVQQLASAQSLLLQKLGFENEGQP